MAMVNCRECRASVSSKAKECPQCGISNPARSKMIVGATTALLILVCLFVLVRWGDKSTTATAGVSNGTVSAESFDSDTLLPNGATEQDRASMRIWYKKNELCRGSSDKATIDATCPKRDDAENALKARGWCWAYEDYAVFPPDYKWHRCSEKTLPLDQRTVQPDSLPTNDNVESTSSNVSVEAGNSPLPATHRPYRNSDDRRRDDARAMVRESWASYGESIKSVEQGYKCDVYDEFTATTAIGFLQVAMANELNNAGLVGDPSMSIEQITSKYIQAGKAAARGGACSLMTPADRGRLRAMVSALMR